MSSILFRSAPIGEARDREILKDATTIAYRQTDQGPVHAHIFQQEEASDDLLRPAFVFFHGGFWDHPMRTQFVPHAMHFAARGAVGIVAETRVSAKHHTSPLDAIDDARFLIAELKRNAREFGIDPDKIIVGGAAGGAFLALHTALPKKLASADNPKPYPAALLLFSALVNTTSSGTATDRFPTRTDARKLSPSKLVRRKLPPMILFHGRNDRITPFSQASSFRRKLWWRGVKCQLVPFDRAEHPFFNFNVSDTNFDLTMAAADAFLERLGLLTPAAD